MKTWTQCLSFSYSVENSFSIVNLFSSKASGIQKKKKVSCLILVKLKEYHMCILKGNFGFSIISKQNDNCVWPKFNPVSIACYLRVGDCEVSCRFAM